jgi:AraC-like DNA-binding protein
MVEDTTGQVLPTATGFAARQAIAALRKRNVEVAPLLRGAGLSEHDLDNRQRRVSAIAQVRLLESAAEALGDSAFGLHLAQQANLRQAGLLFYVTSAARTIGETLPLYERYCRIVNEAVRVKLLPIQNGVIVEFNFVGLSRHHFRQNAEFVLAANLKGMRENVGRNIRPIRVTFAHPRNSHLPEFERFFGCPVEYGSASDQWSFSNETLAVPLISGDPYLLETLQPFCDQAARERNTAVGTLRSSVENELQKLLPHGKANRQTVARALGMSERTLSRKLAGEGTTYDELVDQLRRSLALQYIKTQSISVSQIGGTTRLAPRRTLTWTKGEHSRIPPRRPDAAGIGLSFKQHCGRSPGHPSQISRYGDNYGLSLSGWESRGGLPTPIEHRPMDVVASGPN